MKPYIQEYWRREKASRLNKKKSSEQRCSRKMRKKELNKRIRASKQYNYSLYKKVSRVFENKEKW